MITYYLIVSKDDDMYSSTVNAYTDSSTIFHLFFEQVSTDKVRQQILYDSFDIYTIEAKNLDHFFAKVHTLKKEEYGGITGQTSRAYVQPEPLEYIESDYRDDLYVVTTDTMMATIDSVYDGGIMDGMSKDFVIAIINIIHLAKYMRDQDSMRKLISHCLEYLVFFIIYSSLEELEDIDPKWVDVVYSFYKANDSQFYKTKGDLPEYTDLYVVVDPVYYMRAGTLDLLESEISTHDERVSDI